MAKFAQYYLKYNLKDIFAAADKNDRQKHFGKLFETNESIKFYTGEKENCKELKHEVYHLSLNPDIIIMRIANEKTKEVIQDFKRMEVRHEPPCMVIIDNRQGCRRVAIQRSKSSFSSTDSLGNILVSTLHNRMFHDHNIGIELFPQYYPQDFYKAWQAHRHHTSRIRFNVSGGDVPKSFEQAPADDNSIIGFAIKVNEESYKKKYNTVIELSSAETGAILPVDESSVFIRNLVNFHAATGAPIELVTTDGASFTCFIDDDEDSSKIVTNEIDTPIMEALFEDNGIDRAKAEEKVLAFVNGMKYTVDGNERKEDQI